MLHLPAPPIYETINYRELSQESGIPISSTRRYLDAISMYFPVIEEATKTDRGAICMQYHISGLINKDKLKQDLKRELNYLIDKSL